MAYDSLIDSKRYVAQMTAVADAIRAVTASTDTIDLDNIPFLITQISGKPVYVESFYIYNSENEEADGTYILNGDMYVNEKNVYSYRNTEGYWIFCKQQDVNTNNYILKSSTNDKDNPFDTGLLYKKKDGENSSTRLTVKYAVDYENILTGHATTAEQYASSAQQDATAVEGEKSSMQNINNLLTEIIG